MLLDPSKPRQAMECKVLRPQLSGFGHFFPDYLPLRVIFVMHAYRAPLRWNLHSILSMK